MGSKECCVAPLDACVLFPAAVCDALLSIAHAGFFEPRWTARIDVEWIGALERKYGIAAHGMRRPFRMHSAFPNWEVQEKDWRAFEERFALPDRNDLHVAAAAVACNADCIVTFNLEDFPRRALEPSGLEALHPDAFLLAHWDVDERAALAAFAAMRQRRLRPPLSPAQFADALERSGLAGIAARLRRNAALI